MCSGTASCVPPWQNWHAIMERTSHAKVKMDAEVFRHFHDLVLAAATEQFEALQIVRARQGKMPSSSGQFSNPEEFN